MMKLPWLSTSLSSGLENCPYSSVQQALDRIVFGNDFSDSKFTEFGSTVHNVVERVHQLDMDGKDFDAVELFDQFWRRTSLTDFDFYKFGKENIRAFVERTLYDRPGATWGVEVGFLMDIVNDTIMVFDDKTTDEEIAEYAELIVKRGGVPYRSAIDRIDTEQDGDRLLVYIYDYKTNFVPFTRDQIENSEQLAIYAKAASLIFDADEITVCYDMLRHGRFYHTFPDEMIDIIMGRAVNKWFQFIDVDPDQLPRKLNSYCGYCDLKAECPVYDAALFGPVPPAVDPDENNLIELINLLDAFKLRAKILDQNVKAINKAIGDMIIDENNGEPIYFLDADNNEKEVYLATNPRYEYDTRDVWDILERNRALTLLKDVAKISSPSLNSAVAGKNFANDIKETMKTKFVSPSLKIRNRKK